MTAPRSKTTGAPRRGQQIDSYMPPSPHSATAVLEAKVDALVRQGQDTNETLRSLERAVTKLAVIEERQITDRQAVERAFSEISGVKTALATIERDSDTRLKTLEAKAPVNDLSNGMVAKVVGIVVSAVVGAALVLLLKQPPAQSPVVIQQGAPAATQPVQQAPAYKR